MSEIARTAAGFLISLPRLAKRALALGCDMISVIVALSLTWYFRTDHLPEVDAPFAAVAALALSTFLPSFIVFGLYRTIFRHAGGTAFNTVLGAICIGSIPFIGIVTMFGISGVPRTIGLFSPALLLLLVLSSRGLAHRLLAAPYAEVRRRAQPTIRAFIYGAGAAGVQLLAGLRHHRGFEIVGFLDDDRALIGRTVLGCHVFDPASLPDLRVRRDVTDVYLAMPSLGRRRRADIVGALTELRLTVQTMPALEDLACGRVSLTDLQEVDVVDLLGREPVEPVPALLSGTVDDNVLLVTGAGGSIGRELCRQILRANPRELVLVDHSEFALYEALEELRRSVPLTLVLHPILGSVTDAARMDDIFARYRPNTVYHAAAYKHVPLVENNQTEAIINNAFGTLVLAEAARRHGVANFILISTDKAVRPTSVMGATKRLAEMVLQALSERASVTRFSMVRFGNVLGSSGSVVPTFRQQIRMGGPLTITHPEITRFFMTIPEAAQLVLQAGSMAMGGDVFLLDMGDPINIIDLARTMIKLSGLRERTEQCPDGDIEIIDTGLRPGEKLYEELLIDATAVATSHPRIYRATEPFMPWGVLNRELNHLRRDASQSDASACLARLVCLVPGFDRRDAVAPGGARDVEPITTLRRVADRRP